MSPAAPAVYYVAGKTVDRYFNEFIPTQTLTPSYILPHLLGTATHARNYTYCTWSCFCNHIETIIKELTGAFTLITSLSIVSLIE